MKPPDWYAQHRNTDRTSPTVAVSCVMDLYRRLQKKMPSEEIRDEVEDDVSQYVNSVAGKAYIRSKVHATSFIPPMYSHPNTTIRADTDLDTLRQAIIEHPPPPTASANTNANVEKVISYWTSANSLKQLHRFADSRQPNLLQVPLPDGSNIPSDSSLDPKSSLPDEWQFRRSLIRFLHLPGLWYSGGPDRVFTIGHLYGISRFLLELELEACPPEDNDDEDDDHPIVLDMSNGPTMSWIKESRNYIERILDHVAQEAYKEHQPIGSRFFPRNTTATQLTKEEILQRNLSPQLVHITLEKVIERYEELMAHYPFERLIMDLLTKEDTFERLLSQEHIEDRLINKQVVTMDERDLAHGPNWDSLGLNNSFSGEDTRATLVEKFIYKILPSISMVNRQRRNFRLMREWLRERAWYLVVHIYDSSIPGNEWLAGAIKEFAGKGLRTVYEASPFIPTAYDNIRGSLFGIYPFDISEPMVQEHKMFQCGLCDTVSSGGDGPINTFLVLGCPDKHIFHVSCVMGIWDQEGKYTHSCPTCRHTPEISHSRLGMYPNNDDPCFDTSDPTFVDNPWGYILKHPNHPEKIPVGHYDMPLPSSGALYWVRENLQAAMIDRARLKWVGESMTDNEFESPSNREHHPVARQVSRSWLLQNMDLLQSEGYEMEDWYDSARFAPSVEVAWLRAQRRKRDRKRRRKIEEARQGLSRYRP